MLRLRRNWKGTGLKIQFAFYKASKGTLWSKAIAWFTKGEYSHVEIAFRDLPQALWEFYRCEMKVVPHDPGGTLCFSSASNDGGTRFKILDLGDGKWDLVDVPLGVEQALKWCIAHQGLKYDWRGLWGFVFPWETPDPKDLFCSETAVECSQDQGMLGWLTAGKVSPSALKKILFDLSNVLW